MSTEQELQNLVLWLEENEVRISTYLPDVAVDHPVLSRTKIIDNVILAIKAGDLNAIELGCDLAVVNKHIPFGRALKSNIFAALKNQHNYIDPSYRGKLATLAVKYLNSPYPPREAKPLCRLLKRFERNYTEHVIGNVNSDSMEAKRWLDYLRS